MIPLALATAIVAASLTGSIALNVGVNTLQSWYDVVYADAFWSDRLKDSPALRALAREEAEIARLMNDDFAAAPENK